jgi:hypothetical protein
MDRFIRRGNGGLLTASYDTLLAALAGDDHALGNFHLYHFFPMGACASYLAADELVDGLCRLRADRRSTRIWMVVCLAAVFYSGYVCWWRQMTQLTIGAWVLGEKTRLEHYARVTHKMNSPAYFTKLRVAERIQAITASDEPIAIMFFDPWLYQLTQRPPAAPRVYVNAHGMVDEPDLIRGVNQRRPRILLIRVTGDAAGNTMADAAMMQETAFRSLEKYFGPEASGLRQSYRVSEAIDDVCILRRNGSAPIRDVRGPGCSIASPPLQSGAR